MKCSGWGAVNQTRFLVRGVLKRKEDSRGGGQQVPSKTGGGAVPAAGGPFLRKAGFLPREDPSAGLNLHLLWFTAPLLFPSMLLRPDILGASSNLNTLLRSGPSLRFHVSMIGALLSISFHISLSNSKMITKCFSQVKAA